jgi:short-subunit dehydrogenase
MLYTLITGASKGIGKAFAYECASRGVNLILVARSVHLLNDLQKDIEGKFNVSVQTHSGDLLDHSFHKKIFSWIAERGYNVNMLINNAGMGFYGKFEQQPLEKHIEVMHLNMDAQVKMAHEFLNTTKPNQKRYLLNTVSTAAFQPVGYMAVYCASKAFMLSFTRALRYELRKENANVTALCPGGTETEFFSPAQMETVAAKNALFMMKADKVAKQGLDGLLANNAVVVPGWYNKIGAFSARHAPQGLVVWQASNFFKP